MAQTPLSALTPYCSPTQLGQFHDWRPLARLCQDSDTAPQETLAQFLADPNVLALLQVASGEVESALLLGGRYTPADLQALAGTNAGAQLAKLVADLAVWYAYDRRGNGGAAPESAKEALARLESLRAGERILGFQETADAGRLEEEEVTEEEEEARNGIVTIARPYWGRRSGGMGLRE